MTLKLFLKNLFKNNFKKIILIFFLKLLISIFTMISSLITGKYLDFLLINKDKSIIYILAYIYILLNLILLILGYFSNIIHVKYKNDILFELINWVLNHVKRLNLDYFNNKNTSYLNDRINSDCTEVIVFLLDNLITFILNVVSLLIYILIVININIYIFIFIFMLIPIYYIIYFKFKAPLFKSNLDFKESQNNCYSTMFDQIKEIKFIKAFSLYELMNEQFKKVFNILMEKSIKYIQVSSLYFSLESIFKTIILSIIFIYGGIQILDNKLSIGEFVILNTYSTGILSLFSSYLKFGETYNTFKTSKMRLNEILTINKEENGEIELFNINEIKIRNLKLSYNNILLFKTNEIVLTKGNIYKLSGNNGVGKSSLINILIGLINNYTGDILFNGINIKELNMYKIRKKIIGIMDQESKFIADTIENNILLENIIIDAKTINKYLFKYNFISGINSELNIKSIIGNNNTLSGGEKQKLSIIRCLLKKSKILFLDEPTNFLDTKTIKILEEDLIKISKNSIIIIIDHSNKFNNIITHNLNIENKTIYLSENLNI